MKKILALLCTILLLAASCASAEGGTITEFRNRVQLNGTLPEGYRFSLLSQTELTLEGKIVSDDPAAPELQVYFAFNESYAHAESLASLDENEMELIRQSFTEEYAVSFSSMTTASGDNLLVTRENSNQFLDFYTVSLGNEIELILVPAENQSLTDAQITRWTEFVRMLDVLPLMG
jgi:hypothetical protein